MAKSRRPGKKCREPHAEVCSCMAQRDQPRKSLDEFALVVPEWYERYKECSDYYCGYVELLERLPDKVKCYGHLDMQDLCDIAIWGGNQHGRKQQLERYNTGEEVRTQTGETFLRLYNPTLALGAIRKLNQWGLSYGSKTLMFMDPYGYAILDRRIRECFKPPIPETRNGYVDFLAKLEKLRPNVPGSRPETQCKWRIADIQQAMFQYAKSGGVIIRPCNP